MTNGRQAYDGFAGDAKFWAWIDRLVRAHIVPIVVPFQGSQPSWQMTVPYTNEWARAWVGSWATHLWAVTGGHAIMDLGFEWNKKFPAFDGNPAHRGPGELWGYNGATSYWAQAIKQAVPAMPVLLHLLPETFGPDPGEGGRDWTPAGYWRGQGTDDGRQWCDALALQFELDQPHPDAYYTDLLRRAQATVGTGKVVYAAEYVRPGQDFPGSANVGEARAQHLGRLLLEAGARGVLNGG